MKNRKCPVCGKFTYKEWPGDYDGGKKTSPDCGCCSSCKFQYEEHIKYSFEKQINNYRENIKKEKK